MSIQAQPVTVTAAATRLDQTGESTAVSQCLIKNAGPSTVYLGGSTVTSANGLPLAAGESLTIDLGRNEPIFGITASGSQIVNVLESGAS